MTEGEGRPALRVIIGHTPELALYPSGESFVEAAETAVRRAGHRIAHAARRETETELSEAALRGAFESCDVYVVVLGFRYGRPLPRLAGRSAAESGFDVARKLGKPVLAFLLDESAQGPHDLFVDREHGERQERFRRRVRDSGITPGRFDGPAALAALVQSALGRLVAPVTAGPAPGAQRVFISYRRGTSWQSARLLRNHLAARGLDVFMDVASLRSGNVRDRILQEIVARRHFLVVLDRDTRFEDDRGPTDWLRWEIARAIEQNRNIVPVFVDDVRFASMSLPDDVAALADFNGVPLSNEYYDAALDKLEAFLVEDPPDAGSAIDEIRADAETGSEAEPEPGGDGEAEPGAVQLDRAAPLGPRPDAPSTVPPAAGAASPLRPEPREGLSVRELAVALLGGTEAWARASATRRKDYTSMARAQFASRGVRPRRERLRSDWSVHAAAVATVAVVGVVGTILWAATTGTTSGTSPGPASLQQAFTAAGSPSCFASRPRTGEVSARACSGDGVATIYHQLAPGTRTDQMTGVLAGSTRIASAMPTSARTCGRAYAGYVPGVTRIPLRLIVYSGPYYVEVTGQAGTSPSSLPEPAPTPGVVCLG